MATTTTIQISRKLHEKLTALKRRMDAKTFEEVLVRLLERPRGEPRGRFGSHPEMKPFAHREEAHEP